MFAKVPYYIVNISTCAILLCCRHPSETAESKAFFPVLTAEVFADYTHESHLSISLLFCTFIANNLKVSAPDAWTSRSTTATSIILPSSTVISTPSNHSKNEDAMVKDSIHLFVFLSPCVGRDYNKAPGPYMAMIRKETEENYWKTKRIGAAPGTKAWKETFGLREAAESLVLLSSYPFLLIPVENDHLQKISSPNSIVSMTL